MKFRHVPILIWSLTIPTVGAFTTSIRPTGSMVHHSASSPHCKKNQACTRLVSLKSSSNSNSSNDNKKDFVNDGPFSFMQPALSVLGFNEGTTTYYGPTIPVNESDYPTLEEQQKRREQAKEEMTNIGPDERDRRRSAGEVATKLSIGYAIFASLILDHGDFNGHLSRFFIVVFLFFALGYKKSAEKGL
mmetsp:Transcript_17330/g.32828  ORF Transcript_17330/g.32828 Transcript_17330/m.32828 type:complete len:189 (-) Transcript_17330:441-1007(-)